MIINGTPWYYTYNAKAFSARVMQKCLLGAFEDAIQLCDKAIELNPNEGLPYGRRGNVKNQMGDYGGAINDCNIAIEIFSNDAYAYFTRGIAKRALEDYGGAMKDFLKAVELDAKEVKKHFNRNYAKNILGGNARIYYNKKKSVNDL